MKPVVHNNQKAAQQNAPTNLVSATQTSQELDTHRSFMPFMLEKMLRTEKLPDTQPTRSVIPQTISDAPPSKFARVQGECSERKPTDNASGEEQALTHGVLSVGQSAITIAQPSFQAVDPLFEPPTKQTKYYRYEDGVHVLPGDKVSTDGKHGREHLLTTFDGRKIRVFLEPNYRTKEGRGDFQGIIKPEFKYSLEARAAFSGKRVYRLITEAGHHYYIYNYDQKKFQSVFLFSQTPKVTPHAAQSPSHEVIVQPKQYGSHHTTSITFFRANTIQSTIVTAPLETQPASEKQPRLSEGVDDDLCDLGLGDNLEDITSGEEVDVPPSTLPLAGFTRMADFINDAEDIFKMPLCGIESQPILQNRIPKVPQLYRFRNGLCVLLTGEDQITVEGTGSTRKHFLLTVDNRKIRVYLNRTYHDNFGGKNNTNKLCFSDSAHFIKNIRKNKLVYLQYARDGEKYFIYKKHLTSPVKQLTQVFLVPGNNQHANVPLPTTELPARAALLPSTTNPQNLSFFSSDKAENHGQHFNQQRIGSPK